MKRGATHVLAQNMSRTLPLPSPAAEPSVLSDPSIPHLVTKQDQDQHGKLIQGGLNSSLPSVGLKVAHVPAAAAAAVQAGQPNPSDNPTRATCGHSRSFPREPRGFRQRNLPRAATSARRCLGSPVPLNLHPLQLTHVSGAAVAPQAHRRVPREGSDQREVGVPRHITSVVAVPVQALHLTTNKQWGGGGDRERPR